MSGRRCRYLCNRPLLHSPFIICLPPIISGDLTTTHVAGAPLSCGLFPVLYFTTVTLPWLRPPFTPRAQSRATLPRAAFTSLQSFNTLVALCGPISLFKLVFSQTAYYSPHSVPRQFATHSLIPFSLPRERNTPRDNLLIVHALLLLYLLHFSLQFCILISALPL
jgi:hypothetical protein